MNYISAKEFSKQPEKVQKVFLDWWYPIIGRFDRLEYEGCQAVQEEIIHHIKKDWYEHLQNKTIVPELQMHQLIRFIEDKGYKFIGINNFLDGWNIKVFKSMMQFEPDIELCCDTPLECYWKIACKIATMEE